jgi:hypothetical protein
MSKTQTQAGESLDANVIIDALKAQANSILASALGSTPLESFNIGALGNLPYYWQDPRNLQFNAETYNWIDSNLKANTVPYQFDQNFVNEYIGVLSKISYSLSTADQAKLNQAQTNATNQQTAVLTAWQAAYGSFPAGSGQPIDNIAAQIATTWATPPTTLTAIQNSINPNVLLNNVPASGKPIIPIFANWLNAIGAAVSLENATTLNNAYLAKALAAAQTPTTANGGLTLDTNAVVPAYGVATPLANIINGLSNPSQAATLAMTVSRATSTDYQVTVQGSAGFTIPILDFLGISVGGSASYFENDMATTANQTTVNMSYPGVTLVNFGPTDFNMSTLQDWFYMEPILDAIQNGTQDVSGYKFSPACTVDFSANGPFGYLMGAAISNYPTMTITVTGSNYSQIATTFQQSASVGITFLGIPLGIGGSQSTYSSSVTTNASASSVTITLNPPPNLVAGQAVDSIGWVLGVQTNFPAA